MIRSCKTLLSFIFLIIGIIVVPSLTFAESASEWKWSSRDSGTTNDIASIAYGNGTYVAVGYSGTILTSEDGVSWTRKSWSETAELTHVAYGNGVFVAVGSGGFFLTSDDGVNWTKYSVGASITYGITYGEGMFVTVGFGESWTSNDGLTWIKSTGTPSGIFYSVTYGIGKFVAVGQAGAIMTSEDGLNWTSYLTDAGIYYSGITYGNGRFVTVGPQGLFSSVNAVDASSWTLYSSHTMFNLYDVTYSNNMFVGVGFGGSWSTSSDGMNWDGAELTPSATTKGIAYNGHSFVAVGNGGVIFQHFIPRNVIFDSNGGSVVVSAAEVSSGFTITEPANPTKSGFAFVGWYKEESLTTPWNFSTDKVTEDRILYAKWTPVYTVTFDSMAGIEVPKVTGVISGSKISAPVSPSRCGFAFEGWYTDASYVTSWDFITAPVTGDITLYAKWTSDESTCSVTFDSHGGSATDSVVDLSPGSTITAPAAPIRTGFTFAGWYKDTSYMTQWNFSSDTVTAHITLHAKWKAIINQWSWVTRPVTSANFQGVTYGNNRFVAVGRSGAIATSSDGVSWTSYPQNSSLSLQSVAYGNGTFVAVDSAANKILTSNDGISWTSHDYVTSFNSVAFGKGKFVAVGFGGDIFTSSNGEAWTRKTSGTNNTLQDVTYGNSQFAAVGGDGAVLTSTDGENWVIKAYIPIEAWGITYGDGSYVVVGFDGQIWTTTDFSFWTGPDTAKSYEILDVTYGDGAFVAAYATGALTSIDGETWTELSDVNGSFMDVVYGNGSFVLVGFNGSIVQSITSPTYTVNFDSQGGSAVASVTGVSSGAKISSPADPTRSGYTFAGWYKEAGHVTLWNYGTDTVIANTTLYAKWTAAPATYSVTFDSQGGSAVTNITGVSSGATITAPADPTKSGYTFAGWYKEATYVTLWNYGADTVITNTTLYAKWTAAPATYSVTFDSQGGSLIVSRHGVSSGATISAPADPTRIGYTFAGWYKEATYVTLWNYGTDTVTSNTTLYAKWTAIPATYTVTFDSQGGSLIVSRHGVSSGATISAPAEPTKSGHTFAGWYKEATYVTLWNYGADTVIANTTLYAKWTAAPAAYTVTFDSQGGSLVTSIYGVSPGATISAPADPTRSGYTFAGWYKEATYVTLWNYGTDTVTADKTLYANWTALPSDGGTGSPTPIDDSKVISDNGALSLPSNKTGEVSLGDAIKIDIPANASDEELKLTIEKVLNTQNLLTNKEVLASPVFEILKNFTENFSNPVTLTFTFDLNSLKDNEKPVVFYYDEAKKEWVEVGGIANGDKITVDVDHFTKFAVFAVAQADNSATEDPTAEVNFSDISGHWAEANIKQAVSNGFVKGYADGTFKPGKTVTRAEFAVMLMNALKPQGEAATLTFTDTAKIGAWAQKAVAQAIQAGIIKGYEDGNFRPNTEITRAEMAAMIANALKLSIESDSTTGFADDNTIPTWAKGAVAAIMKLGLVEGEGTNKFDPNGQTTRAEAVTVLLNMLALENK